MKQIIRYLPRDQLTSFVGTSRNMLRLKPNRTDSRSNITFHTHFIFILSLSNEELFLKKNVDAKSFSLWLWMDAKFPPDFWQWVVAEDQLRGWSKSCQQLWLKWAHPDGQGNRDSERVVEVDSFLVWLLSLKHWQLVRLDSSWISFSSICFKRSSSSMQTRLSLNFIT